MEPCGECSTGSGTMVMWQHRKLIYGKGVYRLQTPIPSPLEWLSRMRQQTEVVFCELQSTSVNSELSWELYFRDYTHQ
jgi:hypothetical protein